LASDATATKERRASPRWRLDFPVAVLDHANHEHVGKAADVSGTGLGFYVDVTCALGEAARVRFTLPASAATFELLGVVRSADGTRVGIQFSEMAPATSARLMSAIFEEVVRSSRPGGAGLPDLADVAALEERLARIENAIAIVSSEIKREALLDEAEALRGLIAANRHALARLDS
jgi:hypothetical protein